MSYDEDGGPVEEQMESRISTLEYWLRKVLNANVPTKDSSPEWIKLHADATNDLNDQLEVG